MLRNHRVKIVATLGPASSTYKVIRNLFEAGANVFRLNMSHGSHEEIAALHHLIRKVEQDVKSPIAILADLQGPKLRVGKFLNGQAELEQGREFRLDFSPEIGNQNRACLPHKEIFGVLKPNANLLIDDGKIALRVKSCDNDHAICEIKIGGKISDNKGVNIPDTLLPVNAVSKKDRNDLEFICRLGIDWLALSFVQRSEDVLEAKKLAKGRAAILSKIEKPSAIQCIDEIISASDGIMIARGDLGVELPVHKLPPIQKQLISLAREAHKPVIVATQMLESMINHSSPTRAEVSDVANAIYEGADAIMLSGESAIGQHPVKAVATMSNVAIEVENDPGYFRLLQNNAIPQVANVSSSIVAAAREITETVDVKAIACFTQSGMTAAQVASQRPKVPILAITSFETVARRLCLSWGTTCATTDRVFKFKAAVINAVKTAKKLKICKKKDSIIVVAGVPFNTRGSTNILRVAPCDEELIQSTHQD